MSSESVDLHCDAATGSMTRVARAIRSVAINGPYTRLGAHPNGNRADFGRAVVSLKDSISRRRR